MMDRIPVLDSHATASQDFTAPAGIAMAWLCRGCVQRHANAYNLLRMMSKNWK